MTEETIIQLLNLATQKEAANNALRALGVAIDRMHKGAIWEDDADDIRCHAFIDLDALLKQSGKFALEPWMNQLEDMLENLMGEDIYCSVTPVIYDLAEGGRRIDLQISLDGMHTSDAKMVLQGVFSKLPEGFMPPYRERDDVVVPLFPSL